MSTEHPITPPPELVQQWIQQHGNSEDPCWQTYEQDIATQAARWGADKELEACCEQLDDICVAAELRAARRPKPPTLAEKALEQLNGIGTLVKAAYGGDLIDETIRAALKRLQELENNG